MQSFVAGGIEFFQATSIENTVIGVLVDGEFAICAVEQRLSDDPGTYELEPGCLALENGQWRLLPRPGDHRDKLNALAPEEMAAFDLLHNKYASFKRSYEGPSSVPRPQE